MNEDEQSLIKSFKHRGLERFFRTGSKAGIQPAHASKIADILTNLNVAKSAESMNATSFRLHPLKGEMDGHWSVKVNGNWRITFRFDKEDAEVVDYQDYH